jgi:hypothetical protein
MDMDMEIAVAFSSYPLFMLFTMDRLINANVAVD